METELLEVKRKISAIEFLFCIGGHQNELVENFRPWKEADEAGLRNYLKELQGYLKELQTKENNLQTEKNLLLQQQLVAAQTSADSNNEVMPILKLIQENTKPKKVKMEVDGSKLSSRVRKAFFSPLPYPWATELGEIEPFISPSRLNQHVVPETVTILQEMTACVREYASGMQQQFANKNVDEKLYVQTPFRDIFLPRILVFLKFKGYICVENEWEYVLRKTNDDLDVTVTGKTDHVVKVINTDACAATFEDKKLGKTYESSDISQAMSQMMQETVKLKKYRVHPSCYCGVLQNGCEWVFLFRKVEDNETFWHYVRCPETFDAVGKIQDENCEIVAKFLLFVLLTIDDITESILKPKHRIPINSNMGAINERNHDEDNGSDDHDDDGNDSTNSFKGDLLQDTIQSFERMNVTDSNIKKRSKGSEASSDHDKENLVYRSLTVSNIRRQPVLTTRYIF